MSRATLSEHDGLALKESARMAHPVDLCRWQDDGLLVIDYLHHVFRLTNKGREHCRLREASCDEKEQG